ncbi:MAG: histidine--tRNA ligase [Bacteroidetes bacterium]|nr:histidine--tRNA ligase [Bacteroidota bacterium]
MKNLTKSIEGAMDLYPEAVRSVERSEVWSFLESKIREVMHRYGYSEIRTPILEYTSLIARGVGQNTDIVSKEMFTLERGRHSYVLRPEMTAPIMRSYIQHHLHQKPGVQRYFYMGPCFRAERPQKGRYRQFHQFGAEIIGTDDPRADAEIMTLMSEIIELFSISNQRLRINTLGDSDARSRYRDALVNYLTPFKEQLSQISQDRLSRNPLRILDTKIEAEQTILEHAPLISEYISKDSLDNYELVKGFLTAVNIPFIEDPMLVRGLDYYCHTAFELEVDGIGAQNALAGGGRYDLLAPEIGAKHPIGAVGFAAGMERLILALNDREEDLPCGPFTFEIWVIAIGESAHAAAFHVATQLRRSRFRVGMELGNRSLKAQMRLANHHKARYTILLGDQEIINETAIVKDMNTSQEESVDLIHIVKRITELLSHVSTSS